MSKLNSLEDQRFGLLTVKKRVANTLSGATQWLCTCDCGNEKIVRVDNLRGGSVTSCGCKRVGRKTVEAKRSAAAIANAAPTWPGSLPSNAASKRISILVHDSRAQSSDGIRSYGFGWCKGVDKNGDPLGGHPDVGVFSKLIARQRRQGPVHVIVIRTMDHLSEQGLISPQDGRSYAQWMVDEGVQHSTPFKGDPNDIDREFRALGGRKQWPLAVDLIP